MGRGIQWKSVLVVKILLLLLPLRGCQAGIRTGCGLMNNYPFPPGLELDLYNLLDGFTIFGRLMLEVMDILSLPVAFDDRGMQERSKPVIPPKGLDVVEGPIPRLLVHEGVFPSGDHETDGVEDEISLSDRLTRRRTHDDDDKPEKAVDASADVASSPGLVRRGKRRRRRRSSTMLLVLVEVGLAARRHEEEVACLRGRSAELEAEVKRFHGDSVVVVESNSYNYDRASFYKVKEEKPVEILPLHAMTWVVLSTRRAMAWVLFLDTRRAMVWVDLKIVVLRPSRDVDSSVGVVSKIVFDASRSPRYSLLIVSSPASVGNSMIDLMIETSMLSFYIAFLPSRTLYLEIGLTIWNDNMIVFVNGCVPTILLTLYEAMTAEIMTGSVEGIKASHGILRDGACCRSSLFSVTLSDWVDSIMKMWLASSSGALTIVFFNAYCLSSFLLPPGSGRGLLQESETRSVMRMSHGILVKVLMRLFLVSMLLMYRVSILSLSLFPKFRIGWKLERNLSFRSFQPEMLFLAWPLNHDIVASARVCWNMWHAIGSFQAHVLIAPSNVQTCESGSPRPMYVPTFLGMTRSSGSS
nr:WW domain-containing protein [Tanacetum cinerariifolium]